LSSKIKVVEHDYYGDVMSGKLMNPVKKIMLSSKIESRRRLV
tara:strand:- start:1337 stop:1462 length:126 start_codon:yes stop_codon:yes gene_type:complete